MNEARRELHVGVTEGTEADAMEKEPREFRWYLISGGGWESPREFLASVSERKETLGDTKQS